MPQILDGGWRVTVRGRRRLGDAFLQHPEVGALHVLRHDKYPFSRGSVFAKGLSVGVDVPKKIPVSLGQIRREANLEAIL